MNENKLTSLLRSADLESVEQIAELSPVTDEQTKQRIWAKIRAGRNASASCEPADTVVCEAPPERKALHWLGFAAVAAAMLILMGTVIHTLQQMPSPRPDPGTDVTQASEQTEDPRPEETLAADTQSMEELLQMLADANVDECDRWQGHVIQADRIGNMQLYGVVPSGSVDSDGNDNLTVIYQDPDNESFAWIKYTRATLRELTGSSDPHITGKNLSTLFIGSSDMPKPEEHDGKTQFTVEMQFYRVSVIMTGTTTGELTELIRVLNNALDNRADDELPGTPDDYTFDDLTYQQAQEITGYLIPWEVMGFEELDSLMKLQSIRYHQYNKGNEVWRYLIVIYKGGSGSVRLTYLPGEFKGEALGDLNFADVPEVTFPITQDADMPRTNTGGDVPAYDFRFRNGDWNIHCEAEANDAVIGDFIRFFNFRENGYALRTFYDAEENDDYFFPWQDEVLTTSKIGSYTFHQTMIERSLPEQFVLELVEYAAEPGGEFVLLYTTQQPEEIIEPGQLVDTPDLDALLTEECFERNGLRCFCLDKGAYRIRVDYHKDIAREDLAALIELL